MTDKTPERPPDRRYVNNPRRPRNGFASADLWGFGVMLLLIALALLEEWAAR